MCCLQTGDPGKPEVDSVRVWEPENWETKGVSTGLSQKFWEPEGNRRCTSQINSRSTLVHIFALCVPPMELADAFLCRGGTSALFGWIQMLISSRNSLTETSRNKVSPALSASLSSSWHKKIKHHRGRGEKKTSKCYVKKFRDKPWCITFEVLNNFYHVLQ